jgi:hypothetical protein
LSHVLYSFYLSSVMSAPHSSLTSRRKQFSLAAEIVSPKLGPKNYHVNFISTACQVYSNSKWAPTIRENIEIWTSGSRVTLILWPKSCYMDSEVLLTHVYIKKITQEQISHQVSHCRDDGPTPPECPSSSRTLPNTCTPDTDTGCW